MKNKNRFIHSGQTLVLLLVFILVAITIAMSSVSMLISNAESTQGASQSVEAYYAAEAGVENAIISLLRNPNYSGEAIQLGSSSEVTIAVSHTSTYDVVSTGKSGSFTRIIEAKLDYTNNILGVISWKELF